MWAAFTPAPHVSSGVLGANVQVGINFRVACLIPKGGIRRSFLCPTLTLSLRYGYFFFFLKLFKSMKNLGSEDSQDNIATMLYINVCFFLKCIFKVPIRKCASLLYSAYAPMNSKRSQRQTTTLEIRRACSLKSYF